MSQETITELLRVLKRLERAARHRDGTMGDPIRLVACKCELNDAAREAREVMERVQQKFTRLTQ